MSVALAPLLATFAIATWRADGILFNNDLTNIESCESPFHRGTARTGEPFKIEMLRSSVDETRGVATAHLLAPGLCWVPWWNDSSVISLQDHAKWWMDTFNGGKPPANATEGYMEFLLKGGDFFGPFAEYAHSAGERAIVSWRMQDYQGMDWMSRPPEDNFKDLSKFWCVLARPRTQSSTSCLAAHSIASYSHCGSHLSLPHLAGTITGSTRRS
jgi:hypothetical protein